MTRVSPGAHSPHGCRPACPIPTQARRTDRKSNLWLQPPRGFFDFARHWLAPARRRNIPECGRAGSTVSCRAARFTRTGNQMEDKPIEIQRTWSMLPVRVAGWWSVQAKRLLWIEGIFPLGPPSTRLQDCRMRADTEASGADRLQKYSRCGSPSCNGGAGSLMCSVPLPPISPPARWAAHLPRQVRRIVPHFAGHRPRQPGRRGGAQSWRPPS